MNWDAISAVSGILALILSCIVNWPILKRAIFTRRSPVPTAPEDESYSHATRYGNKVEGKKWSLLRSFFLLVGFIGLGVATIVISVAMGMSEFEEFPFVMQAAWFVSLIGAAWMCVVITFQMIAVVLGRIFG